MGYTCFLCKQGPCKERRISLHKFPDRQKKPDIYKQYLAVCNLNEKNDVSGLRICSCHFNPADVLSDYTFPKIKPGVIPKINVPNSRVLKEKPSEDTIISQPEIPKVHDTQSPGIPNSPGVQSSLQVKHAVEQSSPISNNPIVRKLHTLDDVDMYFGVLYEYIQNDVACTTITYPMASVDVLNENHLTKSYMTNMSSPGKRKLGADISEEEIHVKQRQVPALQKRTALCNCECTCEKRQTVPAPPTTRSEPGPLPVPSTEAAVPNPNNADNGLQNAPGSKQYVINRLSKFEQTEIKENSIVVCDKNARIVINSDDASLRANLVKLVRKVLIQNAPTQNVDENLTPPSKTGEEAAIIILEDDEPEKDGKAPVSKGTTKQNLPTAPIDEEIIKIEVEEDCSDPASNESQDSKALLTKALEEVSLDATARLQAKFKELADSFGTRCPFCGYDVNYQQDVVFHVRRIHHGLFLHRPISDDDIYKELIKKIEILQKEEQEFPVHYLNCNFKMFCRYCEETFSNIDALVGHVKAVHETSCGPLPLSEAQLMSGMRNCKFCNRILTKAEDHSAHVPRCIFNPASKGYQETQVCEFCGKIGTRTQIKSHYATVHSSTGKHLVCERCGRTLSNRASYRNHMLRHENKRAIRCPKEGCNKLFNTAACLRTHKIFHASPDRWKYVCDQCGKRFPVRLSLMTHEDSHSTVRVNCPSCDKTFKGKYALQVHISKYHATMKEERAVVPKENDGEEAGESDGGKAKRKRGAKRRRDSDSADEDYGEGVEVVYLEDLEPGTERRSEDSRGLQGSIDLDETED